MAASIPADQLVEVELFQNISATELAELLSECDELTVADGATVITAGQEDRTLYVVLAGMVEIDFELPKFGDRLVAELMPNSVFGESSFFHPNKHSANVVARGETRLLKLSRANYDRLIERNSLAAFKLGTNAADILAARLQSTDHWIVSLLEAREDDHIREGFRRFRESLGFSLQRPGPMMQVMPWVR